MVYSYVDHLGFWTALKASFFFKYIESDFASAYGMWSQGIIFGVIFTFLVQNMIEKYIPERSCRMIAKEMENHLVVIGYSHLGERLIRHYQKEKIPYCLIEKDKEKIDELLREGAPVVVDNAKEFDALRDAGVSKAKSVIIASNNLETALIVTKRVRQMNKEARIITRCFMEEFDEILESLGANEVIYSSKNAFADMAALASQRIYRSGFKDRINAEVQDVHNLSYADNSFDVVVSTFSFHHWREPSLGLQKC